MSTLSIFFDLHSLQDKHDTFSQVYADSLEPLQYCPDSLDTELVTLCDEDSAPSYKDSPCDSLDSDEPSHLSSDSLEDVWEQEEEHQSDHITPRDWSLKRSFAEGFTITEGSMSV